MKIRFYHWWIYRFYLFVWTPIYRQPMSPLFEHYFGLMDLNRKDIGNGKYLFNRIGKKIRKKYDK